MDTRAVLAAAFAIGFLSAAPAHSEEPRTAGRQQPVAAPAHAEEPGAVVPLRPAASPAFADEPGIAALQPAAIPWFEEKPGAAAPQPLAVGATVGEVRIQAENIFDIADPREDNWLFRLANRLHIRTHPWVIRRQLLFRPGEPFDPRLLAESERILRSNGYLYDARIRAGETHEGRVDVDVRTRDVWTLQPGFSFQRSGGKNTTGVDLKEKNLLGLGSSLSFASKSTPDRRTASMEFSDDHLFGTRLRTDILLASNSDGRERSFLLQRPFYALDARWTASALYDRVERVDSLVGVVDVASSFETKKRILDVYAGWSRGLVNGWVWRFTLGWKRDESHFSPAPGTTPTAPVPADRVLVYPYAGIEVVQDDYETTTNHDQIQRTEDFFLGWHVQATAGYAFPAIGADRTATPFTATLGKGLQVGDHWTLTGAASADGRVENGSIRDTKLVADGRAYLRWSDALLSFATLTGSHLVLPDGDHQVTLGGDTGLRGYPMRYQAGENMFLATLEQRYFSDWYPFRLFRVGGAIFFDAGRAWGGDVAGLPATGVLRDAGFGLRIGNARSGLGNVIHVDLAFPFDGDPSIARVQFLVTTKNSF